MNIQEIMETHEFKDRVATMEKMRAENPELYAALTGVLILHAAKAMRDLLRVALSKPPATINSSRLLP